MKNNKLRINITDVLSVLICLVFFIGMIFVFPPCSPKDDGSFMSCHWAGNAITGISAVLTVIYTVHLFISDNKIKLGLSVAAIPMCILAFLIPGIIIDMCMMKDMRCHAIMRPAVAVFSVVMIILALIDIAVQSKRSSK